MPKVPEQEQNYDRRFLEQMGITANEVVYPEQVSTDDELLELRWRIVMARS